MNRRTFLLSGIAAVAALPATAVAGAPMRISGVWFRGPYPNSNGLNQLKGTLYFRLNNDRSDRALNTYGAGTSTNTSRQCVELIKRYAAKLGFTGYSASLGSGDNGNGLPSVGDGHQAAARFATASNGGFTFVSNGSSTLPKPGAVLSIVPWTGVSGGHVGILCNFDPPSSRTEVFYVKLFDQNMPIDQWKDIRFRKNAGRWYAEMLNNNIYRSATGWANPAG